MAACGARVLQKGDGGGSRRSSRQEEGQGKAVPILFSAKYIERRHMAVSVTTDGFLSM